MKPHDTTFDAYLDDQNLRRLYPDREAFFSPPRGSPGKPGSFAHAYWLRRATTIREAGRAYRNGRLSFRDAVARALQAHLELEHFRHEHGMGAPKERRSTLLTGSPIPLSEPDASTWTDEPLTLPTSPA